MSKGTVEEAFLSNGTCYFAKNTKADTAYIPCGNAKFGPVPCCQIGDFCMSNSACYNPAFGNVYLAGCTEGPLYENEVVCPRKNKLGDQQWVGLVRCKVSDDVTKKEEVWMGCRETSQPLNSVGDDCKCENTNSPGIPYFKAPPVLEQLALLPETRGGKILWDKGKGPSNTPVTATTGVLSGVTPLSIKPTAESTYNLGAVGGTTPTAGGPAATGEPTPAAAAESGLSTGAKAGIGVGAAAGAVALLAIIWLLLRLNRRLGATPAASASSEPAAEQKSMLPPEPNTPAPAYSPHSPYGGGNAHAVTPVVGAPAVGHEQPKPQQNYYAPQELDSAHALAPVEMAADPYVAPAGYAGHMSHVSQISTQHTGASSYTAHTAHAGEADPGRPNIVSPQNTGPQTGPGTGFGGFTPQPEPNLPNPHASYLETRG